MQARAPLALLVALALIVPATAAGAPPRNDARATPQPVNRIPSSFGGTTVGATAEPNDPGTCRRTTETVWYRWVATDDRRVALRLQANGDLDAVVAVYRQVRSQLTLLSCAATSEAGQAAVVFRATKGTSYLVVVAQLANSEPGTFRLFFLQPQAPEAPPGTPLKAGGARSTVDPLLDAEDVYAAEMRRGVTYRINLAVRGEACIDLDLYRPGTRSLVSGGPIRGAGCGGYITFTPGPDGGGRYVLVVSAQEGGAGPVGYHLQFARAGPDDTAPGLPMTNGELHRGSLFGRGIDVVDLYRFDVSTRSDVTLGLKAGGGAHFDVILMTDTGRTIRCGCGESGGFRVRQRLGRGRYYALMRARQATGGRYGLLLLVREITKTSVAIDGRSNVETTPGHAVTLTATVRAHAPAGVVELNVDRFDPLEGWVFFRLYRVRVGAGGTASVSFLPPTVGRWRVHATFLGTRLLSGSESGSAHLLVATPIP